MINCVKLSFLITPLIARQLPARRLYSCSVRVQTRLFSKAGFCVSDASKALTLRAQGQLTEAEPYFRNVLAEARQKGEADTLTPLRDLGLLLYDLNKLEEAESLCREEVEIAHKLFGDKDLRTLSARGSLALVLQGLGSFLEAEQLTRDSLAMIKERLGDDDPQTLIAISNLGQLLSAEAAEPLFREVLEKTRKQFGNEHHFTAKALYNFAATLIELGKHEEAEPLIREALHVARTQLGAHDQLTVECITYLGVLLAEQEKLQEAESLFREALFAARQQVGPATANIARNLGLLLKLQGKTAEADPLIEEGKASIREFVSSRIHTALFLDGLARNKGRQGRHDEELVLRRELVAAREHEYGEHRITVAARHRLARTLMKLGNVDEAEKVSRENVESARRLWGAEEKTATYIGDLALKLIQQGKLEEAETLTREALAMFSQLLGDTHKHTMNQTINLIALVFAQDSRKQEAIEMARKAVEVTEAKLGSNDEVTLQAVANLGRILREDPAKQEEAEEWLRKALEITKQLRGLSHPDVIRCLHGIWKVLEAQKRYAEGEVLLKECLSLSRETFGNDHEQTRDILDTLASLLGIVGKYQEAEPLFRERVALARKHLGEENPRTMLWNKGLGALLVRVGKQEEAETIFRALHTNAQKVYGDYHPIVLDFVIQLAFLLHTMAKSAGRGVLADIHPGTISATLALSRMLVAQEKYSEAEPLLREGLSVGKQTKQTLLTLECLRQLAVVLKAQGKVEEGESLSHEAVDTAQRELGSHSNEQLSQYEQETTTLRWQLKKFAEAESLLQKAYERGKEVLEPGGMRKVLELLYDSQFQQGKFKEAERNNREHVKMLRKDFGPSHPSTLISTLHLTETLLRQDVQSKEAEALFFSVLHSARATKEKEVISAIVHIGSWFYAQGRLKESESVYEEYVKTAERDFSISRPTLLLFAKMQKALSLDEAKKYAEAEECFRELSAQFRSVYDEKHPERGLGLGKIGRFFLNQQKYAEAESLLRESLSIVREVYEDPLRTAVALRYLGDALRMQEGKVEEAEQVMRESLSLIRQSSSSSPLMTMVSVLQLAVLLKQRGKFTEAEPLFREYLKIATKELGADNPRTLAAWQQLGQLFVQSDRLSEAEDLFRKQVEAHRPEHPSLLSDMNELSNVLLRQGKKEEAITLLKECVIHARTFHGPQHPQTLAFQQTLDKIV